MSQNNFEGSLLLEEAYERGKLLYIKDPKIGPDGIKVDTEPKLGHDIIVYFVSPSKTKFIGYLCYAFYDYHCSVLGAGIVDENFKRKKIGSKLLSLIEDDCIRNNLNHIKAPYVEPGVAKLFIIFNGYKEVNGKFFKELRKT